MSTNQPSGEQEKTRCPTLRRIITIKITVSESLYLETITRMDAEGSEDSNIRRTARRINTKLLRQMLNPKAFPHK